jgi:hypothetical protein
MTFNNIYDYFGSDIDLMDYYDPTSTAKNNKEASLEIYHKLVDYAKEKKCIFVRDDIGYVFYSAGHLISFCIRHECRDKENLAYFGNLIKKELGMHFNCYLFNRNTRAIRFLERLGMKRDRSNELITLLSI